MIINTQTVKKGESGSNESYSVKVRTLEPAEMIFPCNHPPIVEVTVTEAN